MGYVTHSKLLECLQSVRALPNAKHSMHGAAAAAGLALMQADMHWL